MFSMETTEKKVHSDDYRKGFEDLLGGQDKLTDKEKKIIEEQAKATQKEMDLEGERMERLKEKIA